MTFLANPPRLNADDVVKYVLALDKSKLTWRPVGVTWHNAGAPNLKQWAAYPESVKEAWGRNYDFYCRVTNGWHSGPHGIGTPEGWAFILCDLLSDGVHASCFNRDHFGFETVGDFAPGADDPLTGAGLASMQSTANLIAAVCEWLGLDPDTAINFHRECARDGHPCPGALVKDDWAKGLVKARLAEIKGFAPMATAPAPAAPAPTHSAALAMRAAVEAFQRAAGLDVDGDPGPLTRSDYNSALLA
jgi:hypothetical protein